MAEIRYKEPGKVTKILNSISILGLFAVAGIIVLLINGVFGAAADNRVLILVLAIVGFICLGSILATPWVRNLEERKHTTLSWIFTGFVALCVVLWIVSAFFVNALISRGAAGTLTENYAVATVKLVRIVLIFTLQFVTSNFIASNILKFGTRMIAFQGIAYISYLYMDAWLSALLNAVYLPKIDGEYTVQLNTWITDIIFSKLGWTLLALAFVWIIVANTILTRIKPNGELELRRNKYEGNNTVNYIYLEQNQIRREEMKKRTTVKRAARKPAAKKTAAKRKAAPKRKTVKKTVAKKRVARKPAAKRKTTKKRK